MENKKYNLQNSNDYPYFITGRRIFPLTFIKKNGDEEKIIVFPLEPIIGGWTNLEDLRAIPEDQLEEWTVKEESNFTRDVNKGPIDQRYRYYVNKDIVLKFYKVDREENSLFIDGIQLDKIKAQSICRTLDKDSEESFEEDKYAHEYQCR